MANSKGIITRKDVMSDDAMNLGPEFASQLKIADKAVVDLIGSVKELDKVARGFKGVSNQKEYITLKQAESLATQQAIDAIKKQEAAELSALKVKRETIKTLEEERKAKQATTEAERKSQKAKEISIKLTLEERVQNELNNKAEKQAVLAKLNLTEAYTKLNNERTKAKNVLRDLIASESASTAEIKRAQKEFQELDARVRKADKAVGDFTKNVGNYPKLGALAGNIKDLVGAFGLTAGIAGVANVLKGAFDTIVKFDQAIADLKAITGATGKDLEFLKTQAIELGKSTKGGAVQVVEAYKLIASAKPELLENVDALNKVTESTLILSKAAGIELPEAATALTDAMNQFGAPAEEAGRFIDALANGAKFGAAEIPQVTEALLKFGAVAKSSNISIEESTALIELLAEKGLKGAEAGTALRNVLLKISAPDALPKEALAVFDKFGISIDKLKDNTIPIQQRLELLKPILGDNANLVKIFGQENIVAARNVLANTDRLKDLTSKMYEYGTAQKQADERSNTLQGKTERLTATYDSFILSLNNGKGVISDSIGFLIEKLEGALNGLIRINSSWDELYKKAQTTGSKVGESQFEVFSRGLSPEEVEAKFEKFRKSFFENRNKLENELKKNEEELAKKNPYGLVNPFGKSIKDYKKEIERLKGEISQIDAFLQSKGKFLNKSEKTATETITAPTSDVPKDDKKAEEARKKALAIQRQLNADEYELQKQRLEQRIQITDEIAKNEEESDDLRIQAIEESLKKEQDLLLLTKNYQLLLEKQKYNDLLEENKGNAENIRAIKQQHQTNILKIDEDYAFKSKKLVKETEEEKAKLYQESFKKRVAEVKKIDDEEQKKLTNEVNNLKTQFINKEITIKEFEEKRKQIEDKYNEDRLKRELDYLRKVLEMYAQSEEQKQLVKNEMDKLEAQLIDLKFKRQQEASEKEKELEKKKQDFIKEQITKTSKVIADSFGVNQSVIEKFIDGAVNGFKSFAEGAEASFALVQEIGNVFYANKISKIDEDIQKNDEYYARQIELAGDDQAQKDLLTEEAEKKRKALEDKKRKEQHKQAVFNKAMSAVQIGLSTAQAIMQSYAQLGPIAGSGGAILAGIMGAIQLAAVLAAPIPKYKMGRKGGPAEFAEVGDGFVHEVVEKTDGRAFLTPNKPTLTYLEEGDKVHSSVDDYFKLQRASTMASLNMQGRKLNNYQAEQEFDKHYGKEILDELKRNTKAIEKNKPLHNQRGIDISHSIWAYKNINWD